MTDARLPGDAPAREAAVVVHPPGALRCPRCGWRSPWSARLPAGQRRAVLWEAAFGEMAYRCPRCVPSSGAGGVVLAVAHVA